jgi:two-component system sensor histidine kinase KdpD
MLIMYFVIALVSVSLTYTIKKIERNIIKEESNARTIQLYNTLLNSLSHELRTPLSTIISAADNLQLHPEKINEKTKNELVEEISKASLRLNYQVENLLNMSRLESGVIKLHRTWCDIRDLINSAVNKLETELKDHQVEIQVPEKFPLFKLDFGLIEQALFNLILNAALYTEIKSIIIISVKDIEVILNDRSPIERLSEELLITIKDNGKGFPPEEVNKVFDKFYRLSNSGIGGTGLGLSISKGFVEAHKGKIILENNPAGGAKFELFIPAEVSFIKNMKNE